MRMQRSHHCRRGVIRQRCHPCHKRKRGRPQKKSRFKSAMELAMQKKSPRKKRMTAAGYDGLGPDDVEFGFKVEGGLLVDGQEGEI